uniref:Uncharacterized protein n=1 Tax=Micrococcus phage Kurnik TaxID=3092208 RepID=A0AAU6R5Z1_9CAUD
MNRGRLYFNIFDYTVIDNNITRFKLYTIESTIENFLILPSQAHFGRFGRLDDRRQTDSISMFDETQYEISHRQL